MSSGVQFNHFPQMIEKLQEARSQIVRKATFDVERNAKQGAPVDTGFLRNSIYSVTEEGSGFGGASTGAIARRAKNYTYRATKNQELNYQRGLEAGLKTAASHKAAQAQLFPEVSSMQPGQGLVLVGAIYGIFVELGTVHMGARPFLYPAAMRAQPDFLNAWRRLEGMLK